MFPYAILIGIGRDREKFPGEKAMPAQPSW